LERTASAFETTAQLKYRGIESTVTVKKELPVSYLVTFQSPDSLKGMEVQFAQDNVAIQYGKMKLDVSPDQLSSSAAVKLLASVIDSVVEQEDLQIELEDGRAALTGRLDSGDFILIIDRETGNFLSLSMPDSEFEMTFENFTFFS